MGSTLSSFTKAPAPASQRLASDDDDEEARPSKRRRTTSTTFATSTGKEQSPMPSDSNRNGRSRSATQPQALQPLDFYGASKQKDVGPRKARKSIDVLARKDAVRFKPALRVDFASIRLKSQDDNSGTPPPRGRPKAKERKCRFTFALHGAKSDNALFAADLEDYEELYRKSQTGKLQTTNIKGEVESIVHLPNSFLVQPEDLYITTKRKRAGVLEDVLHLADRYFLEVIIQPLGQAEDPPLPIPSSDVGPVFEEEKSPQSTAFYCSCDALFSPADQSKSLDLKLRGLEKQMGRETPYCLRINIQWSLPTASDQLANRQPLVSSTKPVESVPAEASASLTEIGETRSKRGCVTVTNYNVRKTFRTILSAKDPDQSPKRRKIREASESDPTLTYSFGRADSGDYGLQTKAVVVGLKCLFCHDNYPRLENLRLHLRTDHSGYKFHLHRSSAPRIQFWVEVLRQPTQFEIGKTIQLGKPSSPLNLGKLLDGNESWSESRRGPLHIWPEKLRQESTSSSSRNSDYSSPNTSLDMDDGMHVDDPAKGLPKADHVPLSRPKPLPSHPRNRLVVPYTKKPLYHSVTKRRLVPGEEYPSSDEENNEEWLHHRLQQDMNNREGYTPEQKDFACRYVPYILSEQLTSAHFMQDAILRFVEKEKDWLAERQSRTAQLYKLMHIYVMRRELKQDFVDRVVFLIKDHPDKGREKEGSKSGSPYSLRRYKGQRPSGLESYQLVGDEPIRFPQRDDDQTEEIPQPPLPARQRGLMDCMCLTPVDIVPAPVICSGKNCPARFYHPKCAQEFGRKVIKGWKCDHCFLDNS